MISSQGERRALSHGNDLAVVFLQRVDRPVLPGNSLIPQLARVILYHRRAVAHFKRHLSLVLGLLHAIAAERMTQRVALPRYAGCFHNFGDAFARVDLEYRAVLEAKSFQPFNQILAHDDLALASGLRD